MPQSPSWPLAKSRNWRKPRGWIRLLSGRQGGDRDQRMPVNRRGDDDDVGLLAREHFAVIGVMFGRIAGERRDRRRAFGELRLINIAKADDADAFIGQRRGENVRAPPPAAD